MCKLNPHLVQGVTQQLEAAHGFGCVLAKQPEALDLRGLLRNSGFHGPDMLARA